jgi:hypothetical protein
MPTIFRDKVTVNGGTSLVTFNDITQYPAGAGHWCIDVLDGWDDTADLELASSLRGGVDGEVLGSFAQAKARHLLIRGYVVAGDRARSEALKDQIRSSWPRNVDLVLSRYEPVPKFVRCRRNGKIEFPPGEDVGTGFAFRLPVIAPDPFKYALAPVSGSAGVAGQSTGGRTYPRTYPMVYTTTTGSGNAVVIVNAGTAPTPPYITLTGPLVKGAWRVVLENTGDTFQMDIGLGAGDTMVLDFRNRLALLNGYPVTANITGDYWYLPPKVSSTVRLYADFDPAAGIAVSAYSAWE